MMPKRSIESGFRIETDLQGDFDDRFLGRPDQQPLGIVHAMDIDEIIKAGAQILVDHLGDIMRILFDLVAQTAQGQSVITI